MSEPISIEEAARFVGVSPATLTRAARKKKLAAKKLGWSWMTTRQDVLAWKNNPEHHKTAHKKYR